MKKIVILFSFWNVLCVCAFGAYKVPLIDSNSGNKYVDAVVNGIRVRFVLDTGCSKLSTNKNVFEALLANGTVKKSDLSSTLDSELANGYTHMVNSYPIKTFQIGDYVFHDVEATVGLNDKETAEPLLGQSIFCRMQYYRIFENYLEFEPKSKEEQYAMLLLDNYKRDTSYANAQQAVEAMALIYSDYHWDLRYSLIYASCLYTTQNYNAAIDVYESIKGKNAEMRDVDIHERIMWAKLGLADQDYQNKEYDNCIKKYHEIFEQTKNNKAWEEIAIYACYSKFYAVCNAGYWSSLDQVSADFVNFMLRPYKITINELERYSLKTDPKVGEILTVCSQLYAKTLNDYNKARWYELLARNVGSIDKSASH